MSWRDEGSCNVGSYDRSIFFPPRGDPAVLAKLICSTCPVRQECLDYALTSHERHGIWGGMSVRERDQEARRRRRVA